MLAACALFAVMANCVYAATRGQPATTASLVSFVRVTLNLMWLLIPAVWVGNPSSLLGDRRASLWLRGLFGGISLILSFACIQRIGPGESAFLTSSSGIFVAALGPLVLGQRNDWLNWLAIGGAVAGMALLCQPGGVAGDSMGRLMGLASGFLAALAYLMIARAGRTNSPRTVVFYFCLVSVLCHAVLFMGTGFEMPTGKGAWIWMLAAGVAGTLAQNYLTRSYQSAPAVLVSAVGYAAPVLSLVLGFMLFDKLPNFLALLGCGLILLSGVALPFFSVRRLKAT